MPCEVNKIRPMKFPMSEIDGIRITTFTEKHISELYVSWLNDPSVVQFSEQRHAKHTLQTCKEYFIKQQKSHNYFLAIELEEEKVFNHVGNIGVTVDLNNSSADMSILIGERRVWGSGVGCRAWMLVMRTLLDSMNFRIITAGTMSVNKPMLALFRRSGMRINGVIPGRFLWEDMEVEMVIASTRESI